MKIYCRISLATLKKHLPLYCFQSETDVVFPGVRVGHCFTGVSVGHLLLASEWDSVFTGVRAEQCFTGADHVLLVLQTGQC